VKDLVMVSEARTADRLQMSYIFLLSNYPNSVLSLDTGYSVYSFETWRLWSWIRLRSQPLELLHDTYPTKTIAIGLQYMVKPFRLIHPCDRETDGR